MTKHLILFALLLLAGCAPTTRTEGQRDVTATPDEQSERKKYTIARISPDDDWWAIASTRTDMRDRIPDLTTGMTELIEQQNCKVQEVEAIQASGWGTRDRKGYTSALLVLCIPDRADRPTP